MKLEEVVTMTDHERRNLFRAAGIPEERADAISQQEQQATQESFVQKRDAMVEQFKHAYGVSL